MEFNKNYEKIFFNYSLANPKYLDITREGFYASKELDVLAYLAKKFYTKFRETPSREQLKLLVQNSSKAKDLISDSLIDLVYESNIKEYESEWLQSTAESWIKWRTFDGSLLDGIEFIKSSKVNPDNVDSIINKFKELITDRNRLNFDKDLGLDFFNPDHHYQNPEDKIASGKSFVDAVTSGGYDKASLVVYAGEQNIGKCSTYSQYITIRNKKTSEISEIKIGDFFKIVKKQNEKK